MFFFNILSIKNKLEFFTSQEIYNRKINLKRIKNRNREAEQGSILPLSYLRCLNSEYQALLKQLIAGQHPWSSSTEIWLIDWNEDWQSMKTIIENIKTHFRVLNFFYKEKKETILVY